MAIFRGVGGSGDSSDNSFLQEVTAQANSASASATSAANSLAAIQQTEVTSASFDTGNGVLTLTKTGGATVTADLDGRFLTSYTETNDLSSAVTWANVPDANITQSSVTQHQAALSITESQISNLQSYLTTHQDISGKANLSGATFTGDVSFNDGVKAKFGTDNDLLIYHNNGEPSVIEDAGELGLVLKTNGNIFAVISDTNESMITATPNAGLTLHYDGTAKVTVGASSVAIGDDLSVQSGNDLYVRGGDLDVTGDIIVSGTVDGVDVATLGANAITAHQDITGKANLSGATFTGDVRISDDVELKLGDGGDFRIFHSSANGTTTIREQGTGTLFIQGENLNVTDTSSNSYLSAIAGGATKIHYNGSTRLETLTGGISVSGDIAVSGTVDGVDIAALNTAVSGKANLSGATFTGIVTAPNVDISTTGSVTTNIATGANNNNNTDVKVVNIGTGYGGFSGSGDSTTINMGSQDIFAKNIFNMGNGVTTANGSTINLKGTVNVDGNVNVDGKITGSTDGVVLEHDKSADLEPVLELQNTTASGSGYRGAFISMTGYNTSGTEYTRGVIGMGSSTAQYSFPYMAANVTSVSCGIKLSGSTGTSYNALTPCNSIGASLNNGMQCGHPFYKWNTVYATNGNIATSDQTHKRDVEELSEAETRVAIACKGLLRKYRWKDAYEEKGEEARIHFGIMAQDLRDAFSAEGLDASRYAMFCSDTWWEDETGERHEEQELAPEGAVETTQLGVRYDELLAFIIAAI